MFEIPGEPVKKAFREANRLRQIVFFSKDHHCACLSVVLGIDHACLFIPDLFICFSSKRGQFIPSQHIGIILGEVVYTTGFPAQDHVESKIPLCPCKIFRKSLLFPQRDSHRDNRQCEYYHYCR